jgi:bifunctional non-homologous end joining protein LigD
MGSTADPLARYRTKRDFGRTPEPAGDAGAATGTTLAFVVQKHAATRLHYDFRLELDGVMLSWAVPKGPSFDPGERRMAIQVEPHPISYNSFEGTIPKGQYGAGTVIVWDRGTWTPVGDPHAGLEAGKLLFDLHGHKLSGRWELVRIAKPGDRQIAWILFKKRDAFARPKAEYDVVTALPDSVLGLPPAAPGAAAKEGAARAPGLAAAPKAELPTTLSPQLATASTGVPPVGDWIFEIKFDGYRLMARLDAKGRPRLITRGGHDWTERMPTLERELAGLGLKSTWLDGEIVVLGDDGVPEFNALQNAFDRRDAQAITYFVFDLPFFDGRDLRAVPLRARRALLKDALAGKALEHVRFSADFAADPAHILESAAKLRLEGVIAKRGDAPYVSQRTQTWLKLKVRQRQEFVVAGFTDRGAERSAPEIGSLILGVHDEQGRLVSVGSVGTGWSAADAAALKTKLLPLERRTPPFDGGTPPGKGRWSRRAPGSERWVQPVLVGEVSFGEWTPDGQIRHALFLGLREDKPAKEVMREMATTPQGAAAGGKGRAAAATGSVKVSHPERVIDASTGLTKLDLVRYYESVAPWLLPHLKGRPCSLVRAPGGIEGEVFFQKHADKLRIPEVRDLDPALWPGHEALLEVPSAKAIAGAAQMNVVEFHTWNAKIKAIDTPDRMVFDLDPGEGVAWKRMVEAAALTRSFLQDLGLQSWLKTSGGKGLHVVVPLAAKHDWATVKGISQAIVQQLAMVIPDRFVARSGAKNRVGRIFVDYLRNTHGATTAAAYSARARPGLGVSMPVPWEMLESLRSGAQWTIVDAREHLSFHPDDPWADYWKSRQTLAKAIKLLDFEVER